MYSIDDISVLIDMSGQVWGMTRGYHVSIRAELRDCNETRPHGLDYGLTLMDPDRNRILGFDNRHAYDGAPPKAPYDHEHRYRQDGRALAYAFTSASQLLTDFFDRVDDYIETYRKQNGSTLRFEEQGQS